MASRGPLEYLVIGFGGGRLPDEVTGALDALTATGEVQIVEAVLIVKKACGSLHVDDVIDVIEIGKDPHSLADRMTDDVIFLDDEFLAEVGATMPSESVAVALLLEHQVRDVMSAFTAAGGTVLASTRLPDFSRSAMPRI